MHDINETYIDRVIPNSTVNGLVVHKDGSVVFALELRAAAVQALGALIEEHLQNRSTNSEKSCSTKGGQERPSTHLSHLEAHGMQVAVMVLDLDGPGLVVVVVLVRDVHNRADHVRVGLRRQLAEL